MCSKSLRLCLTLYSCWLAPRSMGFSRQEYWGSPQPRDGTRVFYTSCTGRQVFYHLGSPASCLIILIWSHKSILISYFVSPLPPAKREAHRVFFWGTVTTTIDKRVYYDGFTADHAHFVCDTCHGIYDFPIEDGAASAPRDAGFRIKNERVIYYGTCAECLKTK